MWCECGREGAFAAVWGGQHCMWSNSTPLKERTWTQATLQYKRGVKMMCIDEVWSLQVM
jgi:hypothetical protein